MHRPVFGSVTLEDVARVAGVSRATASRVLAGSPHVSRTARQDVVRAAAELGYTRNAVARALATGSGHRLVVAVGSARPTLLVDDYLGRVVTAVAQVCTPAGFGVSVQAVPISAPGVLADLAVDPSVGGVILVNTTDAMLRVVPASLIGRVVSIGVGSERIPSVDVDNAGAARAIVAHLVQSGRRRIAMVTGPRWLPCAQRPLMAYRELVREAGLPEMVVTGDFDAGSGYAAAQAVLRCWSDVDAIYAICDSTAQGVMSALQVQGIHIPDVIAVAGFDNEPWAAHVSPALTTASHPVDEIAATAARTVLDGTLSRPGSRTLTSQLILRKSA